MKQLSKANWIRLACFSAGGTLLFYLVPLILMQLPDPAKGNAMVILVMFVNQVFMGVVGWHSNYFGKWGIYIPMVLTAAHGIFFKHERGISRPFSIYCRPEPRRTGTDND